MNDMDGSEISLCEEEGLALIAQAEAITVTSATTFHQAAEFLRNAAGHVKRIKDLFQPMKATAQAAHKAIVEQERRLLDGPEAAVRALKDSMTAYRIAQQREAAIAQARAAEDAMRQEALAPPGSAPIVVAPVHVEIPKAAGISFSTHWHGVVVDKAKLIEAVAKTPALHYLLEPNQKALDELAQASKGALMLAGVEAREETRASAKAS